VQPKRILLTFVGQLREYRNAVHSHADFIKSIIRQHNIESEGFPLPNLEIYISIITWDKSYSIFPKKINSFLETGITKKLLLTIIGDKFTDLVAGIKINVVSTVNIVNHFTTMGVPPTVEEFSYVAFLHEKSFDSMRQFEKEGNFKFDVIILTRPDMLLQINSMSVLHTINGVSQNTVYSQAANTYTPMQAFWSKDEQKQVIKFEQFVDQFNVFGRTAFYAYGLMFRYICATGGGMQLFTPSLHLWVLQYLELFRISVAPMHFMNVTDIIIRPTHILDARKLNFIDLSDDNTVAQLQELEEQWQKDVDNVENMVLWIKKFISYDIPFEIN
jgi:hypothetical protein